MIMLSVCHTAQRCGITYKDRSEFDLEMQWIETIDSMLEDDSCLVVPPMLIEYKINYINAFLTKTDLNIELCFNHSNKNIDRAAGNNRNGSETWFKRGDINSRKMAILLQKNVSAVFKPNKGIKSEHNNYLLNNVKCPCVILKPEYLYNDKKIDDNRKNACLVIANTLKQIIKTQ